MKIPEVKKLAARLLRIPRDGSFGEVEKRGQKWATFTVVPPRTTLVENKICFSSRELPAFEVRKLSCFDLENFRIFIFR